MAEFEEGSQKGGVYFQNLHIYGAPRGGSEMGGASITKEAAPDVGGCG